LQIITPLTPLDFEDKAKVIISKVEIDRSGMGDFVELSDFIDWNINTSIGNFVSQFCTVSFSITLLNTGDKYSLTDESKPCYGWIRNGRRVKIYVGMKKSGSDYNWQWIVGRIEPPGFSEEAGKNVCVISGNNYMNALASTQLIQTYWGTQLITHTIDDKDEYVMPSACKGVYRAFLDSTEPYNGTNMKEIYPGREWTYDWDTNIFMLLYSIKPSYTGSKNLIIYYFKRQLVESVVADILIEAGLLRHYDREGWLSDSKLLTPTNTYIDRVWFNTGTSCMEATRLLAEVILYRFDFDYEGNPIFRPKAQYSTPVKQLSDINLEVKNISDTSDEVKNYISVIGEVRSKLVKVPTVTTQYYTEKVMDIWEVNEEYPEGHWIENKTKRKIFGTIDSIGQVKCTRRGFQWGTSQKGIHSWYASGSFDVGTYERILTGLSLNTDYFYRAWVYSKKQGTFYGQWQNYKTPEEEA